MEIVREGAFDVGGYVDEGGFRDIFAIYDEYVFAKGKGCNGSLLEGEWIVGAGTSFTHEVPYSGFECGEAFLYGVGDVP